MTGWERVRQRMTHFHVGPNQKVLEHLRRTVRHNKQSDDAHQQGKPLPQQHRDYQDQREQQKCRYGSQCVQNCPRHVLERHVRLE